MEIIRTFKSKILLLVLIVLLTAAVFFVVLSKREIESALYHREQEASKNVLYLVLQTIENQYQDLIYHNRTVLEMRKEAMKDLSGVVIDLEKPGKILMRKAMVFTVVALMIGLALAYIIAAKVSRPLSQLAGYAKNLPSQEFRSEPDPAVKELSSRGDEVGRLAEAFLFMQKMLRDYLDHLKKTTAAKERIESELKIAHEIQMSMPMRGSQALAANAPRSASRLLDRRREGRKVGRIS
jgi:methyl-accepting chemotaxis protein